jgi:hypothetical protein
MLRAQPTFSRDRCELVTRTNAHTHSRALGLHLARLHTEAGSAAALTPPTFNPPNGTGRVRHEWRRPERAQHACTLVCTHEHARPQTRSSTRTFHATGVLRACIHRSP